MQNAKCKMQKRAPRAMRSGLTLFAFCILHFAFVSLLSCQRRNSAETLEFWGLGREGEVVAEMIPEFERRNPGIKVRVQQIPWSAAHEKLLTAHVGDSTPDV